MSKKALAIASGTAAVIGLLAILLAIPRPKHHTVHLVTFVDHPVLNTIQVGFKQRLKELTVDDRDRIQLIESNANGRVENLPELARVAVRERPDVILTVSTPVTQAVLRVCDQHQAVVFTFVTNPRDLGDELTRTNATGLSDSVNYAANVAVIREVFGQSARIGMLYNPNEANSVYGVHVVEDLLKGTSSRLLKSTVVREADIGLAAGQLAGAVDVIYVGGDNTVVGAMPVVLKAAIARRVPVFASDLGSIEAGAVAGVSVDYTKLGHQTAEVVYKVLGGTAPRQIPRVVIPGDRLIINTAAARRFGLSLPASVVQRANQSID